MSGASLVTFCMFNFFPISFIFSGEKVRDHIEQINALQSPPHFWWNTVACRHPWEENHLCAAPSSEPMCLWEQGKERESVCVCVCVCVCFKESDNPPSLSLARYLGIRTARKWQTTVKEQVLLGLRCVTEQTLPHQTGCLFCTLPLSSVTYYPNHTESPSCHMVIWMRLIVREGINGVYVCVFSRQAGCSSYMLLSFSPPSSPLLFPPSFLLWECD